jgi:hypothetical protein
MKRDGSSICESLYGMIGLVPWDVRLGYASFLTLEFGKELRHESRRGQQKHGEWHLWLQCCGWRVEGDGRVLFGSEDKREVLERSVERLAWAALSHIAVSERTLDLHLEFKNGIGLSTFTLNRYRYTQWELFKPNGRVLVAKAGGVSADVSATGEDGDAGTHSSPKHRRIGRTSRLGDRSSGNRDR